MGRETDDEREARLKQAGAWLEGELKRRGWTQKHLGEQLGVAPQQVSAYANGRYEIDPELARDLARLLGLSEYQVWKGMRIPLPAELVSDEDAIAWALRNAPEEYERWLRRLRGNPATRPVDKPNPVTRKGDSDSEASPLEEPAV